MKSRNREINIFSLSLMDVISGAMGAFLIVMVIQARYTAVNEGNDPEKLRPRLDAAMEALAAIRSGTETTIANRFEAKVTATTLGLSSGETVLEIKALGGALQDDIDTINEGFARTLKGRRVAIDALAAASTGTEKIFKENLSHSKPATLGLERGKTVPEIEALGEALRKDIGDIERALDVTINQRNAAASALSVASAGTEKIFKDRIGARPATLGLKRGFSIPEIEKLDGALRSDIDTIYKEFRKGKENEPTTPFTVTTVFPCDSGDVSLQVASNEIDPKTSKPIPPYTPVPDNSAIPLKGSWALLNSSLHGSGADYLLRQPAFTYMNSRGVPGRVYKLYLMGFTSACAGHVMMLGKGIRTFGQGRILEARFNEGRRVTLSWPKDSITLSDGKRHGMYFLGTIKVSKDRGLVFATASDRMRVSELAAMQARVDGTRRPEGENDGKLSISRKAMLANIDKLPVPRDLPSCARMSIQSRHALDEMKLSNAQTAAALGAVLAECRASRFPEALKKLKSEMHRVLGGKKKDTPLRTEKNEERSPLTKEAALEAIDKLPIPRNPRDCMRMVGNALRTLSELKLPPTQLKLPPAERQAAIREIRSDCIRDSFQDAQKKLKAVMHQLIE